VLELGLHFRLCEDEAVIEIGLVRLRDEDLRKALERLDRRLWVLQRHILQNGSIQPLGVCFTGDGDHLACQDQSPDSDRDHQRQTRERSAVTTHACSSCR